MLTKEIVGRFKYSQNLTEQMVACLYTDFRGSCTVPQMMKAVGVTEKGVIEACKRSPYMKKAPRGDKIILDSKQQGRKAFFQYTRDTYEECTTASQLLGTAMYKHKMRLSWKQWQKLAGQYNMVIKTEGSFSALTTRITKALATSGIIILRRVKNEE